MNLHDGHDDVGDEPLWPTTPPDFDFMDVVRIAIEASSQAKKDALRFLSLGGDQPRERTGMRWNPSSLEGCTRKAIYKATKCPMDPDFKVPLAQQLVFDRGTVRGAWMAAYLRAAEGHEGITDVRCVAHDRSELLARDEELSFGGFLDVYFRRYGRPYVAEVKSKDNDGAMDKITAPDRLQLKQFNDYMGLTGVHSGWIIYVGLSEVGGKQTLRPIEFKHTFSPEMWEASRKQIRTLEMLRRAPARLGPKSSKPFFECPSCPWRKSCESGLPPSTLLARAGEAT